MSASIREISTAMTNSRQTTSDTVGHVQAADAHAQRLNADGQPRCADIIELIGNITGQINLLALNATIKSARAGEAGRGFAVVASEVKDLANQAKHATDRITQEISALNDVSGDVVAALNTIRAAIGEVSQYVSSTASAVEQQSAVTRVKISSNMQRAVAELA